MGQEGVFLPVVAKYADQVRCGGGQERVAGRARVGGGEEAVTGRHNGFRQLHATKFVIVTAGNEAGIGIGVEGFFYLGKYFNLAIHELRLVFVGSAVVGGELFPGHFIGGFDDGVEGVAAVFAEAFAFAEAFGIKYFVELERQVAAVDQGVCHWGSLLFMVHSLSYGCFC